MPPPPTPPVRPPRKDQQPLMSIGVSSGGVASPIHSPTVTSPSSPFQAAAAVAGLPGHAPSPFSVFGHTTRAQAGFLTLTLGLMFVMLLLYKPSQQEGLLCGSNQAHRARLAYAIEPRTMGEIQRIQARTKRTDVIGRPAPEQIPTEADTPSDSVASTGAESSIAIHYVPIPAPRAPQLWERKTFTAPAVLPAEGEKPRPPARSQEELQGDFRKWEGEFQSLLNQRHGNIMQAFREWIAPGVDPLIVKPEPLHTVDQSVVMLDGRQDPMVIFILKHTFHMLGPGWGLVIFHTQDNEAWFIDQLKIRPGESGEHIQLQRVQPIAKSQANSLAMSSVFYDRIGVETVLLIQPDAFMLRSPWLGTQVDRETWDRLLSSYGYIGAPWSAFEHSASRTIAELLAILCSSRFVCVSCVSFFRVVQGLVQGGLV
jgi:hypothetical protein